MQVVAWAWNDLSKSTGLGSLETANSSHLLYERTMKKLLRLKSLKDGLSPLSQRETFHGMKGLMNSKEKGDRASSERLETADHAMRLPTLELFKHLHGPFENSAIFALEDVKLFEWSAVQRLWFTAPALPPVFTALKDEIPHPLPVERTAMSRAELVELDHEENSVRRGASSGAELCLEESPCLVFGEGEAPVSEMGEVGSKMRKPLSSLISVGKKKNKTATSRRSGKDHGVQAAETEERRVEADEEEIAVVSTEAETEISKEM